MEAVAGSQLSSEGREIARREYENEMAALNLALFLMELLNIFVHLAVRSVLIVIPAFFHSNSDPHLDRHARESQGDRTGWTRDMVVELSVVYLCALGARCWFACRALEPVRIFSRERRRELRARAADLTVAMLSVEGLNLALHLTAAHVYDQVQAYCAYLAVALQDFAKLFPFSPIYKAPLSVVLVSLIYLGVVIARGSLLRQVYRPSPGFMRFIGLARSEHEPRLVERAARFCLNGWRSPKVHSA